MSASFDLPGTKSPLKADVEVAWSDGNGNIGIRFVKIAPQMQSNPAGLVGQQYFAN